MTRRGILVTLALCVASPALAQSAIDSPANLAFDWLSSPGVLEFNFIHRFALSPAPARKVINTPTFVTAVGLTSWATVGFAYGSNSTLVPSYPNEWEWFGRVAVLRRQNNAPLDLVVQGDYNLAAEGFDAAATGAREVGPLRLSAMAGVLSHAFDSAATRAIAGAGVLLRVRPSLALAADVAGLPDRHANEPLTWSAGLQIGIPSTPHSLSLQVTNVGTRTLEGLARGTHTTRVGFEYTVPIRVGGMFHRSAPPEAVEPGPDSVVNQDIKQIAFARANIVIPAGTTVRWTNRDPVPHSVTADDNSFDSGLIQPGETWQHRFDTPGRYRYHCLPHSIMRGVIVVR